MTQMKGLDAVARDRLRRIKMELHTDPAWRLPDAKIPDYLVKDGHPLNWTGRVLFEDDGSLYGDHVHFATLDYYCMVRVCMRNVAWHNETAARFAQTAEKGWFNARDLGEALANAHEFVKSQHNTDVLFREGANGPLYVVKAVRLETIDGQCIVLEGARKS